MQRGRLVLFDEDRDGRGCPRGPRAGGSGGCRPSHACMEYARFMEETEFHPTTYQPCGTGQLRAQEQRLRGATKESERNQKTL